MTEQPSPDASTQETIAEQQQMPELPESELSSAIVAMLFAASEPTRLQVIATTTGYNVRTIREKLGEIEPELNRLGLILQWTDREHAQLGTSPDFASLIRRFLGIERTSRLSPAALEVLAIVGYRQPVTRPEIDSVRGVDSSGVIQTLVARELIVPTGRLPGPGNPVQYGTTPEFLRVFGLTSMEDLPELPKELAEHLEGLHEDPAGSENEAPTSSQ